MQPYTMKEAQSAFHRLLRHHQANGWDSTQPGHPHPGHHPPTAPTPSWSGHSTDALTNGAGPGQGINAGQSLFHTSASQSSHQVFPQSSQHALTSLDQPGQRFWPTFCDSIQRPGARPRHRLSQAAGIVSGKDSKNDPSEAQAKGDSAALPVSQQPNAVSQPPVTLSQQSITLLQRPAQAATRDPVALLNESGIYGQQVSAQPAQVELTNSPDGSNSQLHEGAMDTRGRSQSPLEITVKGNGMQHVGDKGTKNRSCSPQSIAEDPSDGAEAKMRAMSEEVVDVPSPKKLVVDHSAAFSAGHASQQMQASAQVQPPCHALFLTQHCCTHVLQSPHAIMYFNNASCHSQAVLQEKLSWANFMHQVSIPPITHIRLATQEKQSAQLTLRSGFHILFPLTVPITNAQKCTRQAAL